MHGIILKALWHDGGILTNMSSIIIFYTLQLQKPFSIITVLSIVHFFSRLMYGVPFVSEHFTDI